MNTATIERPQTRRTSARPHAGSATEPQRPPATDFDRDNASVRLAQARSISVVLSQVFGNGTAVTPEEIRMLEGLMGAIQHLRRILVELSNEVMEANYGLPNVLLDAVCEGAELATLIDEIEWHGTYSFMLGNIIMSDYFGAICTCCETAKAAIDGDEGPST